MDVITDIDLVFTGDRHEVDLSFIKDLLRESTEIEFSYPEKCDARVYEDVLKVVRREQSIFFIVKLQSFVFEESGDTVAKPFVSVSIEGVCVELLIFFDLKDLQTEGFMGKINLIRSWMRKYAALYEFSYFRCQIGNGAEDDEYYFDTYGFGSFYYDVI